MKRKDLCLALLIAAIWGLNFSFIKLGVDNIDPFILVGLRFTLTALPLIVFIPRPDVSWRWLALYGLVFGMGTWGLVTLGLRTGVAPGLAAWLLQSSAFITPLLGILWLREAMSKGQKLGALVAFFGFVIVILATGGNTPFIGVILVLIAAVAMSVANLLVKRYRIKPAEILGFVVWSSLFAPLPLFVLAYCSSGSAVFVNLPAQFSGVTLTSLLFQVYPTTLFGYWVWNSLMIRYTAAAVAPVALLVPIFALIFAKLIFGAMPPLWQIVGIVFILQGLVISIFYQRLRTLLQI